MAGSHDEPPPQLSPAASIGRLLLNALLCAVLSGAVTAAAVGAVGAFLYGPGHFSGTGGAFALMGLIALSLGWGGLAGAAVALNPRPGFLRVARNGAAITCLGIVAVTAVAVIVDRDQIPWPPRIDGRRLALEFEFTVPRDHAEASALQLMVYEQNGIRNPRSEPNCKVFLRGATAQYYGRHYDRAVLHWPPIRLDGDTVKLQGLVDIGSSTQRVLEIQCRSEMNWQTCALPLRDHPDRADMEWTVLPQSARDAAPSRICEFPLRYRVRFRGNA